MMYRIIFSLIIFLSFFGAVGAEEERPTPPQCATITDRNMGECCAVFINTDIEVRCRAYLFDNQDRLCSVIIPGTPSQFLCCVLSNPRHPNCNVNTSPQQPPFGAGGGTSQFPAGNQTQGSPEPTPITNPISQECSQVMGPTGKIRSLLDLLLWTRCLISTYLLPLLFSIAFLLFVYGVIRYVIANDSKEKGEGKKFLWWGMLGLFVLVSVWGIVALISSSLGLGNTVPQLQQTQFCEGTKRFDPVTQRCR